MLADDYRGSYPHFLLVAARRLMIVQFYPNEDFIWNEGTPRVAHDRLIVYPWAQQWRRLTSSASQYFWSTKHFREALIPINDTSTASINDRTFALVDLVTEPANPLGVVNLLNNLQDTVYMKLTVEAKAYLHRYLVRCDHDVGISVTDFRQYFISYFIQLRRAGGSEDQTDWLESAEQTWGFTQVHLTYYLHQALTFPGLNLELASLHAGRYCDNVQTLADAVQKDGNTHSYKKIPTDEAIANAASYRHEGQVLAQTNPFTSLHSSTIFSASLRVLNNTVLGDWI
jgi:hypothetical protein